MRTADFHFFSDFSSFICGQSITLATKNCAHISQPLNAFHEDHNFFVWKQTSLYRFGEGQVKYFAKHTSFHRQKTM